MSTPEGGHPEPGDEDVADDPKERAGYRKDLSDVVDDIEERVAEQRRSEEPSDTAVERADTIPTTPATKHPIDSGPRLRVQVRGHPTPDRPNATDSSLCAR